MKRGKYGKKEGEKSGGVAKVWRLSDWKHYAAVSEILKARKEYVLCSLLKISTKEKELKSER